MTLKQCIGIALLGLASLAQAQAPAAQQQNGVAYITGGIGADEQQAFQAARPDYNLQLTFATRASGAYRADVAVTVTDAKGEVRLQLPQTGPLLYAKLPPGNYKVSVSAGGKTFTKPATVPASGARDLYFYWEADTPDPEHGDEH